MLLEVRYTFAGFSVWNDSFQTHVLQTHMMSMYIVQDLVMQKYRSYMYMELLSQLYRCRAAGAASRSRVPETLQSQLEGRMQGSMV